jgi:hypothetical protein
MSFPYGQTVTVVSRTVAGQDSYGNDTYTETKTDITPCVVQSSGSTETTQFTDQVSDSLTVFLPYGTSVQAIYALEWNGIRYEVQGNPSQWQSPFSGHTSPIQVTAIRITGVSV